MDELVFQNGGKASVLLRPSLLVIRRPHDHTAVVGSSLPILRVVVAVGEDIDLVLTIGIPKHARFDREVVEQLGPHVLCNLCNLANLAPCLRTGGVAVDDKAALSIGLPS
jgi:hypothetical protein